MSPPPHREKDAKVEGRDQPEKVKETMAPFRSLMGRLLKVPMSEVKEQQKLYDDERIPQNETLRTPKPKKRRTSLAALAKKTDAVAGNIRQQKK